MEILRRHGTLEQTREEAHRHAADARARWPMCRHTR
jgi:hypothetical protein